MPILKLAEDQESVVLQELKRMDLGNMYDQVEAAMLGRLTPAETLELIKFAYNKALFRVNKILNKSEEQAIKEMSK